MANEGLVPVSEPLDPGPGTGADPARDPGLPGGQRLPDLQPADFTQDGPGDTCPPSASLGLLLDGLAGPGGRYDGASDGELLGILGRRAAMESWAAAAKLAAVRELIRRRPLLARDGTPAPGPGDLPGCWDAGLAHEISAALAISLPAADKLIGLAWTLQARLPRTGQAVAHGIIDLSKAKAIAEETSVLDDDQAAAAEDLIVAAGLAGKTWTQLQRQAAAAVCTVDPDGTRKRRERAQRDDARVRLWRETSGTCALAAYGLPPDEALGANASIDARAQHYHDAGLELPIDLLRVMAYADLINNVPAHERITRVKAADADANANPDSDGPSGDAAGGGEGDDGNGPSGDDGDRPGNSNDGSPDNDGPHDDDGSPDDGGPHDGEGSPGDHEPDDGRIPGPSEASNTGGAGGADHPAKARLSNLTIPLATLLGLAARPGNAHALGPLDPDLARKLADAAARSPDTEWCITVIDDQHGYAIGHGCGRPARGKPPPGPPGTGPCLAPAFTSLAALPARAHLTIRLSDLRTLTSLTSVPGRPPGSSWGLAPRGDFGPPSLPDQDGDYGTWALTLPGGRQLTVKLRHVPVTSCDHRYQSHSYKPSDLLRHLIQVRDGDCTYPTCTRHARDSDFEHGIPYDKGGVTCACNTGARSRRCHRVKQSTGWTLTQPRPGWHQWTTPAGRTYTQGPAQYPA